MPSASLGSKLQPVQWPQFIFLTVFLVRGKWLFFTRIHASCDLGGPIGVLWGPSEFILDHKGWFFDVILRIAALGTKYDCLVWVLLHNAAVFAQYREMALPF